MCNLIKDRKRYIKTTGCFANFYRNEPNTGAVKNINYFDYFWGSKSFDFKTSITTRLKGKNTEKKDVKNIVPLNHLRNFGNTRYIIN